jgi:hypothetical protein
VQTDRRLILFALALTITSTSMLAVASSCRCQLPRWVGPVDVGVALALVVFAGVLWTQGHAAVDVESRRIAYDLTTFVVPLSALVLWLDRDGIDWNVFLPGIAWRSFIVLHALPIAVASWRRSARTQTRRSTKQEPNNT